ncbi:MAG: phosphotransferase, partial [Acidimicrobiia bacterium]
MGIASEARDDEELRAGIERWLHARRLVPTDATVEPLTRPAAGLSSDTCFARAVAAPGAPTDFVIRLPPAGDGLFPEYDLRGQVDRQNELAARAVPIAAPARFESDPKWLGAPFMVMPRIRGFVLSRAWLRKGPIAEATPEFRHELMLGFVRTLAALHRLPVEATGAATAAPTTAPTGATAGEWCSTWSDYLDWASGDREPPEFMTAAGDWCR